MILASRRGCVVYLWNYKKSRIVRFRNDGLLICKENIGFIIFDTSLLPMHFENHSSQKTGQPRDEGHVEYKESVGIREF